MKERPILMHARSVQGILAGRKIQTRRIIKPQPENEQSVLAFNGVIGDRFWVREAFYCDISGEPIEEMKKEMCYRADVPSGKFQDAGYWGEPGSYWKPSIHMPRWASRLTLEITDIRVERVQDISEGDCKAEGIRKEDLPYDPDSFHPPGSYGFVGNDNPTGKIWPKPQQAFAELWDDTNGAGAWERNDWVWAVGFNKL